MRWMGNRQSENVEDRRRMSAGPVAVGGGLGTLILVVAVLLMGGDPGVVLRLLQQAPPPAAPAGRGGGPGVQAPADPADERRAEFARVILADTEDVWSDLFRRIGRTYQEPTLVLFSGQVDAGGCGFASAAVGPFYCPADGKAYLDLDFFEELADKFGAPGEFAQAYVLAHEIGHHVQNLLGTSDEVRRLQARAGRSEANDLSVRLELQADFYAGVWAHHAQKARNILERGDVEAGLRAAAAIGDDTLQRRSGGSVMPDSFTHGSSAQRVRWFRRGLETGDMKQGDTFSARDL